MGRDKDRKYARSLETPGCVWRQFIMGLHVGIVEIAVELELIVTDLFVERDIPAPAFLFRIGTRSCVEVKARQYGGRIGWQPPHPGVDIERKSTCRSETVGTVWGGDKYPRASAWRSNPAVATGSCEHISAHL